MQPASPPPPPPPTIQATQTSQIVRVNGSQSAQAVTDNMANTMPVTKRSPKDYIFGKVIGEGSYSTVRINYFICLLGTSKWRVDDIDMLVYRILCISIVPALRISVEIYIEFSNIKCTEYILLCLNFDSYRWCTFKFFFAVKQLTLVFCLVCEVRPLFVLSLIKISLNPFFEYILFIVE